MRPRPRHALLLAVSLFAACKGEARQAAPASAAPTIPARAGDAAAQAGDPVARTGDSVARGRQPDPGTAALPCAGLPPRSARYPAAPRIVAIGDLHGDLDAARRALVLAGAIRGHDDDRWRGGDLVIVQTGDILDRGDQEQAILDLFDRLAGEARAAGGAVHTLLGNHETMNAAGDFRYVTDGGFVDFQDVAGLELDRAELAGLAPAWRARAAALLPGGPYARMLATRDAVIIVGDTVFAHGGVLPRWADYGIDRLNREIGCWLAGAAPASTLPALAELIGGPDTPLWSRDYSTPPERCDLLARALERLGAARMVVGHTPQRAGITAACDQRVWRIDVGMAAHYGGPTQVLEIRGADVGVLAAP